VRRAFRFLVHNWPLKIAAIGLATLLYAGFVVSRDSRPLDGPIRIDPLGLTEDATVIEDLPPVTLIRYTVIGDVPFLTPDNFRAEVDLSNAQRDVPVTVSVRVRSLIGGVIVQSVQPSTIVVTVESIDEKVVPVEIDKGDVPADVTLGPLVVTPSQVKVRGAKSLVAKVDHVAEAITIEPAALDIDREMQPIAVDANGVTVPSIRVEPRTVRVQLQVINDQQSRSGVPLSARFTGAPAPGYHVAAVAIDPTNVAVVGDADDLAAIQTVETQPIELNGETASITRVVSLSVPENLSVPDVDRVTVRITIELETGNRTFNAGIELVGRNPQLIYDVPVGPVTVALFGSLLDLDRIGSAPLLAQVDVTGLGPGTHVVTVRPLVPSAVTVASSSPTSLAVTIAAAPASASPSPGSSPAP